MATVNEASEVRYFDSKERIGFELEAIPPRPMCWEMPSGEGWEVKGLVLICGEKDVADVQRAVGHLSVVARVGSRVFADRESPGVAVNLGPAACYLRPFASSADGPAPVPVALPSPVIVEPCRSFEIVLVPAAQSMDAGANYRLVGALDVRTVRRAPSLR